MPAVCVRRQRRWSTAAAPLPSLVSAESALPVPVMFSIDLDGEQIVDVTRAAVASQAGHPADVRTGGRRQRAGPPEGTGRTVRRSCPRRSRLSTCLPISMRGLPRRATLPRRRATPPSIQPTTTPMRRLRFMDHLDLSGCDDAALERSAAVRVDEADDIARHSVL